MSSVILGIDPGTKRTGYGLVAVEGQRFSPIDYGCIELPAKELLSRRYRTIFLSINELLEKFTPSAVAVESQFVRWNVPSVFKILMAHGVAVLAASLKEIPIFAYSPAAAKKAVTGSGRASKEQVQLMMQKLLGLTRLPEPADAADALALALCHAQSNCGLVQTGKQL